MFHSVSKEKENLKLKKKSEIKIRIGIITYNVRAVWQGCSVEMKHKSDVSIDISSSNLSRYFVSQH